MRFDHQTHNRQTVPDKSFKTYSEQVDLLASRGMFIGDRLHAIEVLKRVSYYRLSGYWYPFRIISQDNPKHRADDFYPGTTFDDVESLYAFDARLRAAVLTALAPIELTIRALLGYGLGRIDVHAHMKPETLGSRAKQRRSTKPSRAYEDWKTRYLKELRQSHEDFVAHHNQKYGGRLPVWAAVEILDWGKLTRLFGMAPDNVRTFVAETCNITPPQLESWLKSLNIVRNYAAHHGRMFNRVFDIKPKLPRESPVLDPARTSINRLFGQLCTIQFLQHSLNLNHRDVLTEVLTTYPDVALVPLSHTGTPGGWNDSPLWNRKTV